jgi:hypothetical protein
MTVVVMLIADHPGAETDAVGAGSMRNEEDRGGQEARGK